MVAPEVALLNDTFCAEVYTPGNGLNTGSAAVWVALDVKVQVLMFWIAVSPPVPPVKPT
jgi:hypothetical protein